MKQTKLSENEKLEALYRHEKAAVANYEDPGKFRNEIEKMEQAMKRNNIKPDRFLQYKKHRPNRSANLASLAAHSPTPNQKKP